MNLWIQKIIVWPLCLFLFVGFIFVVNGYVLCIGEDGHIEFETECLPCCKGTDNVCKLDVSNDLHDEHGDCTNCSDLALDGLLWSRRFQKISFIQSVKSFTAPAYNIVIIFTSNIDDNSKTVKFHLIYGQSPPSLSIATTVLRC